MMMAQKDIYRDIHNVIEENLWVALGRDIYSEGNFPHSINKNYEYYVLVYFIVENKKEKKKGK